MTHHVPATFVVGGHVRADGNPVVGVRIRAFDKALRRDQPLGETTTNDEGRYDIHYSTEQLPPGTRRHANVFVRAFSTAGIVLGVSDITFDAPATTTIDLT